MPFATVGAWLALGALLGALCAAPGGLKRYRWLAALLVVAVLSGCLAAAWGTAPQPLPHWQGALVFDNLAHLLLPPLWTGLAGVLLTCLFLPDPRYELAFAALCLGAATAGIMSASPLLTVALLQGCALLTLAGLVIRAERPGGNSLLSIATALKYITLTVVSAACLVMALLLSNFYALNQDRLELPRIIVAVLIVGFGLAVGMMPLYFHLPDLFDAAPIVTTASFIGPLQCLGVVYLIRSAGNWPWLLADDHVISVLTWGALGGALLAAALSFGQRNLHRVLAFNAIRETGWLAFGLGSVTQAGWSGALILLAGRCIGQPLLLAAIGVLELPGRDGLTHSDGAARHRPIASVGWTVGIVATIGIPPTTNFWGLEGLFRGSLAAGWFAPALLLSSALLGLWRFGQVTLPLLWTGFSMPRIAFRSLPPAPAEPDGRPPGDPTPDREPAALAWLVGSLAFGVVVGGLVPRLFSGAVSDTLTGFSFLR